MWKYRVSPKELLQMSLAPSQCHPCAPPGTGIIETGGGWLKPGRAPGPKAWKSHEVPQTRCFFWREKPCENHHKGRSIGEICWNRFLVELLAIDYWWGKVNAQQQGVYKHPKSTRPKTQNMRHQSKRISFRKCCKSNLMRYTLTGSRDHHLWISQATSPAGQVVATNNKAFDTKT